MNNNSMFRRLSLSVLLTSTILSSSVYGSSSNNNNNETREEYERQQAQLAPVMGARAVVQQQAMQEVQVVSQDTIESIQKFFKQQHIPTHCEDNRAPVRLLSLDGGGLRGLIFLPQLRALEILTGKPVCELFDVIGGTSTGGISAIALSYRDDKGQVMSAKDVINLYLKCGRDIFRETAMVGVAGSLHNAAASAVKLLGSTTGTKYAPDGLESIAAKMVGTNKFAQDRFKIPVLVTAVDNTRQQLKIFCTADDEDMHLETVKIVRATSAAQSFFPAIQVGEVVYIDGGHLANQPAKEFRDYYVDVLAKKLGMPKDLNVFSFGTGDASQIKQPEELHAQWLAGKIESTIQLLFAKQEKDANRAIINEVKLTRMKSLIAERDAELKEHELERIKYRSVIDTLERQLIDDSLRLSVGMDDHNVEHMRENSQKLKENIAELRVLEREAEGAQNAILTEIKDEVESLQDELCVHEYYRTQTDPLPKALQEMDDIKQAGPLFEKGLEMLKNSSFKDLLKGIFGPEFTVADELLNILCDQIRGEVNGIDIFDSKPLTMVSIIDDFINAGAARANLETFFSQRLERAGLGDISNLNATQLSALMKWTHALLAENQKHKDDRTFPQKAATGVKGVLGYLGSSIYVADQASWEGLHDKISRLIQAKKDECLKQIVTIMRNKKTQVVENSFNTTDNIKALIADVVYHATPTSSLKVWADAEAKDDAKCAQKAFEERLLKPLGLALECLDRNDTDYLTLVYWLLEEVKIHVCEGQSGSWGLRRAVKNSVRTMAGHPVYMSRHHVLYGKIVDLQNAIKMITASPLLIDSDEADSFEFASEEGSVLESSTQSE